MFQNQLEVQRSGLLEWLQLEDTRARGKRKWKVGRQTRAWAKGKLLEDRQKYTGKF